MPAYNGLSPARSWWAVAVFTVALMFNYLDRQLLTLLVTPIKADLGLSDTQISLLVGFAFVLFYVLAGIPVARLVDRGPRKWIIGFGIAFWSLMTACCGLASNFWQLTLARMGVGVGESCNAPATYSMTSDMFPRDKLAQPISVIGIGTVAGSGLALLIGGWLITWLTDIGPQTFPLIGTLRPWQMTFLIVGLPGVLWALVLLATVPEPPRRESAGAQTPSFLATMRFIGSFRGTYAPMFIANGVKAMLSFGTAVWSPAFFERQFGYAPGAPGPILGIISLIVSPIGLILGGYLANRMAAAGYRDANMRMVFYVTIPLIPVAVLYPLLPQAWMAYAAVGLSLFLGSLGAGPANAAVQAITPGRMRGTVTAIYIAIFNVLGYGLGPLVIALLSDNLYGTANLGFSMATTAAVLGPVGLVLAWVALRPYGSAVDAAEARGD
ncbi:spinster family MFS transporter [Altericroceibacterium endophyticum]|uniref:MFS transporter n=1 Tax=Altericroceibacterium endophyticum TaxID=1808508 RepID=A0A6I4T4G3_9SPHN|nr:MFS transporter [Altericroceibacterium endophyticum]MXO66184.1 MFS transporter [Altericroceibacterium endophyticum]